MGLNLRPRLLIWHNSTYDFLNAGLACIQDRFSGRGTRIEPEFQYVLNWVSMATICWISMRASKKSF